MKMGMADPRSYKQQLKDFQRDKDYILGMVEELIAVNKLEYHNKNWLSGDTKTRCEATTETLGTVKCQLEKLKI